MAELDDVAGLECVVRHLVAVDKNAIAAVEIADRDALCARDELGVPPRQQRVGLWELAFWISSNHKRAGEQQFALGHSVVDDELSYDHGRSASNADSTLAQV